MNVDTPAPLNLSLTKAKNQRATKHSWILGFEVTCSVEVIKKIRKREFPRLKDMVGISFTSRPWGTPRTKSFNPLLLFKQLG